MRPLDVLEQTTIWLSTARSVHGGRASRDYLIYDDAGSPLLAAQTSAWRRDIVVQFVAEPRRTFLLVRRRLLFPLSGKVDVYDDREARVGVVSRSGRYEDMHGVRGGHFRDARTFGERARESALAGVLDALLGADGTTSYVGGPTGFVWLVGSQVMGTLGRAPLPFGSEGVTAAGTAPATTSRLASLSRRVRELVGPARPQGWKLERLLPAPAGDPRLVLAAALFTIELSHW
jgi:hypothetical protein